MNGTVGNGHSDNYTPIEHPYLPLYDDLPPVPGMPHGCTWGLWDKGKTTDLDQLGTLNLLTPSVVASAAQEVRLGMSVALNWRMDRCNPAHSGRAKPRHRIFTLESAGGEWTGHDDEVCFNTQGGSQWDGFRHWAHQPTKTYYNGVRHQDITDPKAPLRNGIDEWSKRGGIVGRGVLLDYLAWSRHHHKPAYHPAQRHGITISELEQVAAWQQVTFRPGDILLIRSGFVEWYNDASEDERRHYVENGSEFAGVEGSEEAVKWFWNHRFAAVGGDASVFEAWPAIEERWRLHDNLIALFGMPVGEMFDLERLSEVCRENQRWSFLFTSAPLNFPGGVASPPNAICVM